MSIGKSLRFEIFARDGFTCQYCGSRPPDVVLEVDHVHPRSKGGSDESINLITSCYDCNRGKRAKVLNEFAPRPDADMAFLKIQQESAEVKRFFQAKKQLERQHKKLVASLQESWSQYLTEWVPSERVIVAWLQRYGAEEVYHSIIAAVPAYQSNRFGEGQRAANGLIPWVGAILRNREQGTFGGVQ